MPTGTSASPQLSGSSCCLSFGREVIGGLFFGHPEPCVFYGSPSNKSSLGLRRRPPSAIDNARLYEDSRRAAAEREQLLQSEREARAEAERISIMKDEFLADPFRMSSGRP